MGALISVILPSHNGSDTLQRSLDAMTHLRLPDCEVEFILIDNASDDATQDLLKAFAQVRGGRFISEERRGKSFALNTAIAVASGDLLVFTDDDTPPAENWLQAFLSASERHPLASVYAGSVRPHWMAPVSDIVEYLAQIGRCCGCTPENRPEGDYPPTLVKGANVMIRRSALSGRRFDEGQSNFGAASRAIGGEDTRLMMELADAGHRIIYIPDARVSHIVQQHEMMLGFIFKRQLRIGRGIASMMNAGLLKKLAAVLSTSAYGASVIVLLVLFQKKLAAVQLMKFGIRLGRLDYWLRAQE